MRNTIELESRDYFSHNPQDKKIGFILLTEDELESLEKDGEVTINSEPFEVVENDSLETE
tara:strand:+ start:405 stop:584 length:180 start_codon:yes stop_codon:yes gene_type:complete